MFPCERERVGQLMKTREARIPASRVGGDVEAREKLVEVVRVGEARAVEFVRTKAVGAGEARAIVGEARRRYWRSESGGEAEERSSKISRQRPGRRAATWQARWSSDGRGKACRKEEKWAAVA